MSAIVIEETVRIPDQVRDLESFRHWVCSDEFPPRGRYSFLDGELWIDMSPEEILTHNLVKGEYAVVIGSLAKTTRRGRFSHDRALLTHIEAGLSTEPDGMFVLHETLKS